MTPMVRRQAAVVDLVVVMIVALLHIHREVEDLLQLHQDTNEDPTPDLPFVPDLPNSIWRGFSSHPRILQSIF